MGMRWEQARDSGIPWTPLREHVGLNRTLQRQTIRLHSLRAAYWLLRRHRSRRNDAEVRCPVVTMATHAWSERLTAHEGCARTCVEVSVRGARITRCCTTSGDYLDTAAQAPLYFASERDPVTIHKL
jgi:hypothetical protein